MLNAAYAYLVERAELADAMAEPAYRVAQVSQDAIDEVSQRRSLDAWLTEPMDDRDEQLVKYLTS